MSVVTPSFNQRPFLDQTIRSVLDQEYPTLQYIVVDGGSSDGSLDVIRRHEDHLAYWTSGPDKNHYDAINKGFARSDGEIMAWINSDDCYMPWAFSVVSEIFAQHPEIEWLTSQCNMMLDDRGRGILCAAQPGFSRRAFMRGETLPGPGNTTWIQQESTFWRRSLWNRAGGYVDPEIGLAGDFELWARFYQHADLWGVRTILGAWRMHDLGQKTDVYATEYVAEAWNVLQRHGGRRCGAIEGAAVKLASRMPLALRAPLARAGIACLYPTVQHGERKGGWYASIR